MEQEKFDRVLTEGREKLTALFSPIVNALGGNAVAYNAYLGPLEVVVLGYQYQEGGHVLTKPVAILVDDDVFANLRVDHEEGRVDPEGNDVPPLVQ